MTLRVGRASWLQHVLTTVACLQSSLAQLGRKACDPFLKRLGGNCLTCGASSEEAVHGGTSLGDYAENRGSVYRIDFDNYKLFKSNVEQNTRTAEQGAEIRCRPDVELNRLAVCLHMCPCQLVVSSRDKPSLH